MIKLLNNSCFLQSSEGAMLLDGLQSSCRNSEIESFLQFRNIYPLLLEIGILSDHPSRIKLSSTSPVGITTSYHRSSLCYCAYFSHSGYHAIINTKFRNMDPIIVVIMIAILIMSVVFHELSHGYVAELLGDPTPRLQGRLTVNPIKHLDLFGSIIIPILTSIGGFTFGWAKPIEWNPYNVKSRRVGEFLISAAGPSANILIAIIFGLVIRFGLGSLPSAFLFISSYIVMINITLAIFNLIPIPPLDGSKIFFSLLPPKYSHIRAGFEQHAIFLIFIVIIFLWRFVEPIIPFVFTLITGHGFY